MKALAIFALLVFAGCSTTRLAPVAPQSEPPEKANRIVIVTADAPEAAYRSMIQALVREGFTLASSSDAALTATTGWKSPWGDFWGNASAGSYRVSISVAQAQGEGSHISLLGELDYLGSAERVDMSRGMKGSINQRQFEYLQQLASLYPGGTLLYARD